MNLLQYGYRIYADLMYFKCLFSVLCENNNAKREKYDIDFPSWRCRLYT